MKKKPYRVVVGIALLFLLAASACDYFETVGIGKVVNNPRDYAGRTVTVSGEVTEVFSFFVVKYFVVADKTGQIAVVSDKPLPKKGTTVKVRGTVREAFALGDQQLLVLVEESGK